MERKKRARIQCGLHGNWDFWKEMTRKPHLTRPDQVWRCWLATSSQCDNYTYLSSNENSIFVRRVWVSIFPQWEVGGSIWVPENIWAQSNMTTFPGFFWIGSSAIAHSSNHIRGLAKIRVLREDNLNVYQQKNDKENVIYTHNRVLFSHKKKEILLLLQHGWTLVALC